MPVQCPAVLPWQQQGVIIRDVPSPVAVDQRDELRVQRQVPALAQLADRDVQPGPGADVHDGVSAQAGVFADPQSGAQQHSGSDADQHPPVSLAGAQQLGDCGVVEGLGQGVIGAGQ
jgi:hypothetical protein